MERSCDPALLVHTAGTELILFFGAIAKAEPFFELYGNQWEGRFGLSGFRFGQGSCWLPVDWMREWVEIVTVGKCRCGKELVEVLLLGKQIG